jgi:hypothetical protein
VEPGLTAAVEVVAAVAAADVEWAVRPDGMATVSARGAVID